MYKQLRNDGFTLVEIIVSIAIGSVVLGLVLSIILTAFNTYGTFSTKKLKKEALDNIVNYVREEIQNSTDVVISTTPPQLSTTDSGNWKWFAVANDRLYQGNYKYNKDNKSGTGSGRMFTDDNYYNTKDTYDKDNSQTKISIKYSKKTSDATTAATSSTSKVRIVTFYYTLSNASEEYKKDDAIEFSNVSEVDPTTSLNSGDLRALSDVQAKDAVSLNNTSTTNLTSFTNNDNSIKRLYYQKKSSTTTTDDNNNNKPNSGLTHTVADKIYEMTANSNRGYYVGTANNFQDDNNENFYENPESKNSYNVPLSNTYRPGDFVYYKGHWWLLMSANGSPENNEPKFDGSGIWQCLDGQFHTGNTYNYGDIVLRNKVYYKYLGTSGVEWNNPENSETDDESNPYYKLWLNLGTNVPSQDGYDKTFINLANSKGANAISQKTPSGSPALDKARASLSGVKPYTIKYDSVPVYNSGTFYKLKYNVGDLIQVEVKNSGDSEGKNPYYRLYKKIFEPADYISEKNKVPGNSFQSGWELLENEYMPSSSYTSGATLRLGTSNLDNLDTTADFIRVKTPSSDTQVKFDYYDSKEKKNSKARTTLTPMDICSSEAEVYFGIKYNYIDKYNIEGYIESHTYNGEEIQTFVLTKANFIKFSYSQGDYDYYNYDDNGDKCLTKAMIYLPSESGQSDNNDGGKNNKTVRNQIWERISLDDMGEKVVR